VLVFRFAGFIHKEITMQKLQIGQEVWGCIESPVTVMGTNYQAWGSVTRLDDGRYKATIGGRADGTGFENHYPTQQQAMAAVHLPLDGEFKNYEPDNPMIRMATVFDT
jgi:hypothetical protein